MSIKTEPQVSPVNGNAQAGNASSAPGATTPESEVTPAVADFRPGFLTQSQCETLLALGEEPREYRQMMESLAGCGALSTPWGRSGKRYCKKKMLEKYEQSQYVYENKQISDKMPGKKSDIYVLDSDICG